MVGLLFKDLLATPTCGNNRDISNIPKQRTLNDFYGFLPKAQNHPNTLLVGGFKPVQKYMPSIGSLMIFLIPAKRGVCKK